MDWSFQWIRYLDPTVQNHVVVVVCRDNEGLFFYCGMVVGTILYETSSRGFERRNSITRNDFTKESIVPPTNSLLSTSAFRMAVLSFSSSSSIIIFIIHRFRTVDPKYDTATRTGYSRGTGTNPTSTKTKSHFMGSGETTIFFQCPKD
jgi:hypothetical protein